MADSSQDSTAPFKSKKPNYIPPIPSLSEIRGHIQDALDQREQDNAFGVSLIPSHAHTGSDSQQVAGEDLKLRDSTTNDVSETAHGFAPIAPGIITQFLRGDGTWAAPTGAQYATSTASHASGTGNQAITGVGFQPSMVVVIASFSGVGVNQAASWGVGKSSSNNNCIYYDKNVDTYGLTAQLIVLQNAAAKSAQATIVSMDSDGFTINWNTYTAGAPTSLILYMAFK